ncbi:MAG TPA: hypothetical protein VK442_03910 [Xanthobacteraceae bacterium]|nr:hypothetical protein [Xanthobacteraceae bacterium]
MSVKSFIVIASLAALSFTGGMSSAAAQTQPPARTRPHPRIEVNPRPLIHRRCADWYVLQYRPSGTVLFPEQHCWWVRG